MRLSQHLYTFLPEGRARRGGAQTVHLSPALSADDQARLERYCLYERPDWLSADSPHESYPVTRGYFLLDASRGVLAQSVYRGKHGIRAGNFLTHHLVFSLEEFATVNPLRLLAVPELFAREFWEDAAPPADLDVLQPAPLPFDAPALLYKTFGAKAEELLGAVAWSLLGGAQAPRVVVALPPPFFDPAGPSLACALGLSALLPRALRPALSFSTYRLDPVEPRLRLSFVPVSAPTLRTVRGDAAFVVVDPEGSPAVLPEAAREYAKAAMGLARAGDAALLVSLQDLFAELVVRGDGGLPPPGALLLCVEAAGAGREPEVLRVLQALPSAPPVAAGVARDVLLARVGPAYQQALAKGTLSGLGLRLLGLSAPRGLSDSERAGLLGFAAAAARAPARAPWDDLLALLPSLHGSERAALYASFSPHEDEIAAALREDQLVSLLGMGASTAWLRAGLGALAERGALAAHWPGLAALARAALQSDPLWLFRLLRRGGLHAEAAELFVRQLLPQTSPLAPLLPEALESMRAARYEEGEVGRVLLEGCPKDARPEVIVFAAQRHLLGAFRRALGEVERASLRAAAARLAEAGGPSLSEELERLGLYRQALRLFAEQGPRRPVESLLLAIRRAVDAKGLELTLEVALEYAAPHDASALLHALAARAREARLIGLLPGLEGRILRAFPEAEGLAVLPAAFLDQRPTRALGARLLAQALDRRPREQRRAVLLDCLRRVTLAETSERELAEALVAAFAGAPDARVSWLAEEAERAGLPLVARVVNAPAET